MPQNRLKTYFLETDKHIDLMRDAFEAIENILPISNYEELGNLEKFALNALIFRFSKLQDLLGSKIFRNYLDFTGFSVANKSFFDILKELEKEGIVDIDSWNEFRVLRNQIAHDYPQDEEEILQSIDLILKNSKELIAITKKIEDKFNEINQQRDR